MKKVFLALLVAIATSTCAFAQKGKSAAGINLGYGIGLGDAKDYSAFDLGLKYQYGLTDAFRVEALLDFGLGLNKDYGYGVKAKNDVITYGINVHYLVNLTSALKIYPIVGIGGGTVISKVSYGGASESDSTSGFMYNVGAGGEYSITENIALGLEIKFQSIIKDGSYNRLPIELGASYKF